MNLFDLGFEASYYKNFLDGTNGTNIARVISVNRESFIISDGLNEFYAKVTGKMMFASESPLDFPTTGDFVFFSKFENDETAIIQNLLPRRTQLVRKNPGNRIEPQLIAANIDAALIMQSVNNDFNINRLERYLSMVNEFGVEPIVLLSKTDLIDVEELENTEKIIRSYFPSVKIISFSNFTGNLKTVDSILAARKTYCIIGSSGVGKTTLLNNLLRTEIYKTMGIRESDGKGRHATTVRQLVLLENGAMIIDTPGMRELGNIAVQEGIEKTFDEITDISSECQFNDCTHTVEKGCAVLKALNDGVISEKRYKNFIKLKKESDYYERSYLEKRRRDKEFGKMCKSIMKNKRNK
jgi:ribosome biogenesis GTPase